MVKIKRHILWRALEFIMDTCEVRDGRMLFGNIVDDMDGGIHIEWRNGPREVR